MFKNFFSKSETATLQKNSDNAAKILKAENKNLKEMELSDDQIEQVNGGQFVGTQRPH